MLSTCAIDSACGGTTAPAPLATDAPASVEAVVRALLVGATVLPDRAEVVAIADALAVEAARAPSGAEGARLAKLAGDLRARMWRVGHAESDAREALELYASASRQPGPQACDAAAGHAAIAAELAHDPGVAAREAHLAAKSFDGTPCARALEEGERAVAAYRPAPDVLAAIEAEAAKRAGEPAEAPDASARKADDERGVVVSPEVESSGPVKIVSIEPYGSDDRARVVVTLSGPARFEVGALASEGVPAGDPGARVAGAGGKGPRLFIDLAKAKLGHPREIAVGGLVERVRVASRSDGTRIVLDLSQSAYRRVFYLPEPFRIVIDVANRPPVKLTAPAGSARPVARVAVDPGHGGTDPGATGPSGLREKDVTLDIAHRVAPVLSRELGIMTLLTRDDDRYVALDERAARANAFHADLFVSIHCNASENGSARGVMSFVLDTTRDEIAARVAARENATSVAANAQVASIVSNLRLADQGARSTHFAELLQKTTMASIAGRFGDVSDQGVKTAGFFVLVGAEMPGVLYETSFISNPTEETRLGTAEYRQKLADAIVNAIRAYREGR